MPETLTRPPPLISEAVASVSDRQGESRAKGSRASFGKGVEDIVRRADLTKEYKIRHDLYELKEKRKEPPESGQDYDLRSRVFTYKEIKSLLKRGGAPSDLAEDICSLAFSGVAAEPAHDAPAGANFAGVPDKPAGKRRRAPNRGPEGGNPTAVGDFAAAATDKATSKPLWANRKDDPETAGLNPAEFVRRIYKDELAAGTLARSGLRQDKLLYQAYATHISRYPDDDLGLPHQPRTKHKDEDIRAILDTPKPEQIATYRAVAAALTRQNQDRKRFKR